MTTAPATEQLLALQAARAARPPSDEPGPESMMFQEYVKLLKQHGFQLPALVPQV